MKHKPTKSESKPVTSRGQKKTRRGKPSVIGHVCPPVRKRLYAWKHATANALLNEAETLPYGKVRRSITRRAIALKLCGTVAEARACECGAIRAATGRQANPPNAHPCQLRSCPLCSRRSAQRRRSKMKRILAALTLYPNYALRFGTLQAAYDPRDPAELTIEALRARIDGLLKAMKAVWRAGLRRVGTGLVYGIEIAGSGFVHLHFLCYGPYIPKKWLEETARTAFERVGHSWIEKVADNGISKAVLEVCKYIGKSPSPLSEAWYDSSEREVMDPVLAARWELACAGRHLIGVLGVFRGAARPKVDPAPANAERPHPAAADASVTCSHCGRVGCFRNAKVPSLQLVLACHRVRERAFLGSKWVSREGPVEIPKGMRNLVEVTAEREGQPSTDLLRSRGVFRGLATLVIAKPAPHEAPATWGEEVPPEDRHEVQAEDGEEDGDDDGDDGDDDGDDDDGDAQADE